MSHATWYTGDTREVLKTLPDASVDLVMTSPPFLALRSYLPADDPNKALEIGSESTPGEFLDVLLDVVVELRRVLAPHGSLVVELGDTYAGGGQGLAVYNDDRGNPAGMRDTTFSGGNTRTGGGTGWPLAKSLCMVPSSFAFALAYGRNPWTGRTLEPWRVRNLIAWCRPNPPVGALGDKFRPGTSYMTVACVGASRYFDLDAVREPVKHPEQRLPPKMDRDDGKYGGPRIPLGAYNASESAGAPPLDWWEIPTHPYPGSHYATFPPALCVRPIKAMCPQKVCRVCGKPSERITEPSPEYVAAMPPPDDPWRSGRAEGALGQRSIVGGTTPRPTASFETVGWSSCGCRCGECWNCLNIVSTRGTTETLCGGKWRNGVVLDPFAGSGTTLEVATGHGRDAIGIDLDPRNLDLARQRIGMFLTEAEPDEEDAA